MDKKITINWTPSKEDKTPIYKQIINYFSKMIIEGHWPLGSLLPTQRDLAKCFNVNRSTIVMAMDELMATGIIETAYGGGTKVANNSWPLLAYNSFTNWKDFISAGPFKSNQSTIQTINKLEFEDYIRLGTGELDPNLFPKKLYDEVMSNISKELISLSYLEPLGLLELRKELIKRFALEGINLNEKQILITSGSLQALQLISICMLNEDSIVFTESPSYIKSLQVFQSSGIQLSPIDMDNDGIKYWQISTSHLKRKHNQIIYTIPDFHNPTSISMSQQRREELLKFSKKYNLPIIEDCAYSELYFDKKHFKPLRSYKNNNNVLHIGTVSKTLAPGLRVGWIVGPESVIERLGDVKMQIDYGASSISQLIVKEFFATGLYDMHLNQVREELKLRRDNAITAINKYLHDKVTFTIPKGGFYIWLEFKKKIHTDKLFQAALQEKILLNPGSIYDFENNNCLRISYCYEDCTTFEQGIKKLAEIIKVIDKKNL